VRLCTRYAQATGRKVYAAADRGVETRAAREPCGERSDERIAASGRIDVLAFGQRRHGYPQPFGKRQDWVSALRDDQSRHSCQVFARAKSGAQYAPLVTVRDHQVDPGEQGVQVLAAGVFGVLPGTPGPDGYALQQVCARPGFARQVRCEDGSVERNGGNQAGEVLGDPV
jgi:hypothetical protein